MGKTFWVISLVMLVLVFGFVSPSDAGTDMIIDNSAQAPLPKYNYAPPPPAVVYYAPPPVRVVVYPTYSYCARPVRVYGYHRFHGRRGDCAPGYWR